MDLQSLFVNLCYHEESKIMCKDIMKENFKDKSSSFISKKSRPTHDSDNDNTDHVDFEDDYYVKLASSVAMIVKHFGKSEE